MRSAETLDTQCTLVSLSLFSTRDIDEDEVEELYCSMNVRGRNSRYRLHSVYVRGVDGLSIYEIEKIFAEFDPEVVEMIDEASCNVIWSDRYTVAKMMLEMTKPLKRVRSGRQVEDGEVSDTSEEEDGEMREEQGDDVTINIIKEGSNKDTAEADVIEVDVNQVEIPPGKWRVITKHVGQNRLIILRFSLREDIAKGCKRMKNVRKESTSVYTDPDGYSYKWMNRKNRVRPGLNIFDDRGNELEWDYEHDTRFYEPEKAKETKERSPASDINKAANVESEERTFKVRGRGVKRFKTIDDLLSGSGSLAADHEEHTLPKKVTKKESYESDDDENESDLSDDRDPSPTPQPWDLKRFVIYP
ncbi:unnamed protein product [Thelazia callipaeda]|uniref:Nuclear cap-binding protein subunit 3 n=1 Tax=Thelazia callipaeda TaxID=103827 RepID=A0A0N5D712_THECL|nr:unnamed protein product [Thelazia callipaeda]